MSSYNTGNLGMGMGVNAQPVGMHSHANVNATAGLSGANPAYTAPIAAAPQYAAPLSAGIVLVLYILLVIILRSVYC